MTTSEKIEQKFGLSSGRYFALRGRKRLDVITQVTENWESVYSDQDGRKKIKNILESVTKDLNMTQKGFKTMYKKNVVF